jgi:hypothetical protein
MVDAQLLAHPAVRPDRRFPKLVGDKLALLVLAQLPPRQVQRTGQRPLLILTEALLHDFRAFVAEFVSDGLSVEAVDDSAPGAVAIDQDGDQDAVDGDVVLERQELRVGERGQFEDRLVADLPGGPLCRRRHGGGLLA